MIAVEARTAVRRGAPYELRPLAARIDDDDAPPTVETTVWGRTVGSN
jgi:hypothetical protein